MNWFETITPTEFELLCTKKLKEIAKEESLSQFKIIHNEIVEAYDGNYQIDIKATFTALKAFFTILCECKCYKSKVPRDVVMLLDRKLQIIGANKGIIMAVNGFQSGAIEYAEKHGIALFNIESASSMPPSNGIELLRAISGDFGDEPSERVLQLISYHTKVNTIVALLDESEKKVLGLESLRGEIKNHEEKIEIEIG